MAKNVFEEGRRLTALRGYGILDTPPEPQFEDIAELVSELCKTPVAVVSFADKHRHWSKARIGSSIQNLPWDDAICSIAIDDEIDPLVIENLAEDPRTRDKSIVKGEPHIKFYAGVTLRTPEGVGVGQLCVVDYEPRPGGLSDEQLRGLQALARHTMALLWLRIAILSVSPPTADQL